MGGQPRYTEGFAPLPRDLGHIPFNDIAAARAAITDDVAAVIVELIKGEGGVLIAHADTLMRKTVEAFIAGVSRDSASHAAQAARTQQGPRSRS